MWSSLFSVSFLSLLLHYSDFLTEFYYAEEKPGHAEKLYEYSSRKVKDILHKHGGVCLLQLSSAPACLIML